MLQRQRKPAGDKAIGLVLLCLSLAILAQPIAAQPKYTVHDLGTLGGSFTISVATGLSTSGQVVGVSYAPGGETGRAFRTASNTAINPATDDLGSLGGVYSSASGINASGQVVGYSLTGTGTPHAFRTAPNSPINPATNDLGTLGGTQSLATGINASGQVVGQAIIANSTELHGFRTAANSPINPATDDLSMLIQDSQFYGSFALGINSSGQVVGGFSAPSTSNATHAFRTAANSPINPATDDLGSLGGGFSFASGINASGQVVGYSLTGNGTYHAFRTASNAAINPATDDLGSLGGGFSYAAGINASGQVVGDTTTGAFVYVGGVMYDLNNLIPVGSGWTLDSGKAINDAGQIVGQGSYNGQPHAFRLDPLSPANFIAELLDAINSFNLPQGITTDLSSLLRSCLDAVERGNNDAARNQLRSFENKVNALRGKNLTDSQADTLFGLAAAAIQLLS